MVSAKGVAILLCLAIAELVQTAPLVGGSGGSSTAVLLETHQAGGPYDTIHSAPNVVPGDGYKRRLEKIYDDALKNAPEISKSVKHQEKLEQQNLKLRRRVKELRAELGDEHAQKMSDQIGAVVATAAEYEAMRVHSIGLVSTLLILGGIIVGGQIAAMVSSKDSTVRASIWSTFERILIVFVVVAWFQLFDDFFRWLKVSLLTEVICSMLHAALIFIVMIALARKFMQSQETMAFVSIVMAWGVHYLSFMLIHVGGHAMLFFSSHIWLAFLGVFVLFFVFSALSALTRKFLLKRYTDNEQSHFVDHIEELEDDASGMMLAFVFTLAIRFLICGRYEPHFADMDGLSHVNEHTIYERMAMLTWTLFTIAVACFVIPRLNEIGEKVEHLVGEDRAHRMLLILNPFLIMNCVWAFLLWADWEFYETLFRGEPVLGRVVFAIFASLLCFTGIMVFAKMSKRMMHEDRTHQDSLTRSKAKALDLAWRWADLERRKFVLNALSVLIAFSWGEAFNSSVDAAVLDDMAPVLQKLLMTILVTTLAFPVYYFFVKNKVPEMQRLEDEDLEFHK